MTLKETIVLILTKFMPAKTKWNQLNTTPSKVIADLQCIHIIAKTDADIFNAAFEQNIATM